MQVLLHNGHKTVVIVVACTFLINLCPFFAQFLLNLPCSNFLSSCRYPGHHQERASESRSGILVSPAHRALSLSAVYRRPQCCRPV